MFSRLPPYPRWHARSCAHTYLARLTSCESRRWPGGDGGQIEDGTTGGNREEEMMARWRKTHLLFAFLQTADRRDVGTDASTTRQKTSWERRRGLSGINNGWQILRDLVQTLIMDKTQLEKRLSTTEVRWESPRTVFPMRHDTFWRDGEVLFYISTCALSYFCCWRLDVSIFGGITSRGTETPCHACVFSDNWHFKLPSISWQTPDPHRKTWKSLTGSTASKHITLYLGPLSLSIQLLVSSASIVRNSM